VQTDGWSGNGGLEEAGYAHRQRNLPAGADVHEWLPRSHIVLSNFKRWTLDVFHGVSPRHLQAYLDELCYPLNRRAGNARASSGACSIAACCTPARRPAPCSRVPEPRG